MRSFLNLNLYATVEAATLIGLTFVAATSYIYNSVMARKRKSAASKAAQKQATPSKGADSVPKDTDTRPETSPYGSPACTIPFASPLTLPLDILKKSPKLHAAYESRLPELPAIPEDVGHVLVHYLHTGRYESLKPKPTDAMSKQICELKTSIQAYAAARAYDLPELMRLAEAKIDKYGEGLPLPALLEVARDAYPTLNEGDSWFLDYLRSRIRPHLKDPKSLIGSNLLDQISGILSPHKILLRTVLELFCERSVNPSEPVNSPLASSVTSPGSSRPVSPFPPLSPSSLLEMRSRSIVREEFPLARKRATPWPSPDALSEASWSQAASTEAPLSQTAKLPLEATVVPQQPPQRQAQPHPFADVGPVILDVVPPPEPTKEAKAVVEPVVEATPEPEVKAAIEPPAQPPVESELKSEVELETKDEVKPETKDEVKPETKDEVKPETKDEVKPETKDEVKPETKDEVRPESKDEVRPESKDEVRPESKDEVRPESKDEVRPESKDEVKPESKDEAKSEAEAEVVIPVPETKTTAELETKQEEQLAPEPVPAPVTQRERKDSGKGIELEPELKELDSVPEALPELDTQSKLHLPVVRRVRDVDSGFWEGPAEVEPAKEPAPSVVELGPNDEPVAVPVAGPASDPVHELETVTESKEISGVDTRDFADSAIDVAGGKDNRTDGELDVPKESRPAPAAVQESTSETAVDVPIKTGTEESAIEPEPLPAKPIVEDIGKAPVDAAQSEIVEPMPKEDPSKEVEAQPETEKAQKDTVEPKTLANPESEPKADSSDPIQASDDAQPAGPSDPKEVEPSVEPESKPTRKSEIQAADSGAAVNPASSDNVTNSAAVLDAKPAPEQKGAKTEADAAPVEPCSAQVRQRSWKRRFLSLRYPAGVLFGRGM
ncbi:hypothetical protein VTK26DRAFT_8804 [Humicola hyalothermophila]